MNPATYVNLTTGLEYFDHPAFGLDFNDVTGFTRLQSTALEQVRYDEFITQVPDDMIFRLALGQECWVYDAGSRSPNGVSHVIWQGLPFIKYVLWRTWFPHTPLPEKPVVHQMNVSGFFELQYEALSPRNYKRLAYPRRRGFDPRRPRLHGAPLRAEHDGDPGYYGGVVRDLREEA